MLGVLSRYLRKLDLLNPPYIHLWYSDIKNILQVKQIKKLIVNFF